MIGLKRGFTVYCDKICTDSFNVGVLLKRIAPCDRSTLHGQIYFESVNVCYFERLEQFKVCILLTLHFFLLFL